LWLNIGIMTIDFDAVHSKYQGKFYKLCQKCGGRCENNETVIFFPKELDYVLKKLEIERKEFIKKYCSAIKYKNRIVYMAKLGRCPFLDGRNQCRLEKFGCKLLRCKLYPTVIGLNKRKKPRIFVHHSGCPMSKKIPKEIISDAFNVSKRILSNLPSWWLEFANEYDESIYDYSKLDKIKNKNLILTKELEDCKI
jgi:Fe-S-cluster containining protein